MPKKCISPTFKSISDKQIIITRTDLYGAFNRLSEIRKVTQTKYIKFHLMYQFSVILNLAKLSHCVADFIIVLNNFSAEIEIVRFCGPTENTPDSCWTAGQHKRHDAADGRGQEVIVYSICDNNRFQKLT